MNNAAGRPDELTLIACPAVLGELADGATYDLVLKHYKRVVLVDTGRYDLAPLRERVAEVAACYDVAVEEVPGRTRILDALEDFRPELF
jgi:Protein of unknown function (DUF1638)